MSADAYDAKLRAAFAFDDGLSQGSWNERFIAALVLNGLCLSPIRSNPYEVMAPLPVANSAIWWDEAFIVEMTNDR